MVTKKILLKSVDDIKNFVDKASLVEYEIDLISGRYTVNAKSIMGVFSLDLTGTVTINIYEDSCEDFLKKIEKFIVND
ncbi:HPr family phosphocarrier protein [Clostridium intestinale]|uniref:HPr family phosphocarrier protein n=1 Tax=Clostridium intestinale TaxID=36845 RepID=UPI002DD63B1A|nr:HPr family phosphocarrier protein [Clostridium intestinale]WRY50964.1 HPr family phosphocarrier protein [Clostridium intestinale]